MVSRHNAPMRLRCPHSLLLASVLVGFATSAASAQVANLEVDATDAPLHIFHVRQSLPLPVGTDALVFPRWLPGEHGPTGPINDLVNLKVRAAGQEVAWVRDAFDLYTFHLQLPKGTTRVELSFDAVTGVGGRGALSPAAASFQLAIVKWNTMLLYPRGVRPADYPIAASVRLPPGWRWASALPGGHGPKNAPRFSPTSLETLIDSPLLAGAHTRAWALGPAEGPPHTLFAAADSSVALQIDDDTLEGYRKLVQEAGALFGARPYARYLFLVALSNHVPAGGLEHHESSDNRMFEDTWLDPAKRLFRSALLPHELVHSWNGKHRRPAGEVVKDYQQPYDTRLLWVYEGLTSYLGEVLAARAGLRSPERARELLAMTAAGMDAQAGRHWRPLADTATAAPLLTNAVKQWRSLRRGLDYYPEMVLVWLQADAIIRQRTNGQRSLDDFCRRFFGGVDGKPSVVAYEREDVLRALDEITAHDWGAFFAGKIEGVADAVSPAALEAVGWKLSFASTPSPAFQAVETATKEINLLFSLGLTVAEDGAVVDVLPGQAAARAGVGPAMQIVAVNGRRYSADRLRQAVAETPARGWVELLVENADYFSTRRVFWKRGHRYPILERDPSRPDRLTPILSPLVADREPATPSQLP